jgi:hypothetical protein
MRPVILASIFGLAACSQQLPAYVDPVSPEAAARMSFDMADLIKATVKPASGAIDISKPADDVTVAPGLVTDLEAAGFTVADTGKHHLSYQVMTIPAGLALRLSFDDWSAARPYTVDGAMSTPAGPFSIQGGGE